MKLLLLLLILLPVLAGAQNVAQKQIDSIAKVQKQADAFVDSLTKNTSLKSFQEFLFDVEGAKRYATFLEQYNFFIKQKYDIWIQQTNKPKTTK